jgi:hypothetical protein
MNPQQVHNDNIFINVEQAVEPYKKQCKKLIETTTGMCSDVSSLISEYLTPVKTRNFTLHIGNILNGNSGVFYVLSRNSKEKIERLMKNLPNGFVRLLYVKSNDSEDSEDGDYDENDDEEAVNCPENIALKRNNRVVVYEGQTNGIIVKFDDFHKLVDMIKYNRFMVYEFAFYEF